ILIDVRTAQEFNSGHIAGAINIPVDQIANRLSEIPADIPVVVYCRSGNRSAQAANILNQNDYSEIYDLGSIIQWQSAGYPIQ
ncbi:MAG: rhodanese-like domain-containing protein, partial [Chloroflexota bacterium]